MNTSTTINPRVTTVRMSRASFDKWMQALLSGEYKQASGTLKQERENHPEKGGFCCLGVLEHCLIGDVERSPTGSPLGYPGERFLKKNGVQFKYASWDGTYVKDTQHVPTVYIAPLSVRRPDGSGYMSAGYYAVSHLNDNGVPFETIASLLKNHVEFTD